MALSEIYGIEQTARAIVDALEFQAFSCQYIENLLQQRQRPQAEPGALHLTRRQDLLELELPEPDLALYDPDTTPPAGGGETPNHEHQQEEPHEPQQDSQDDAG